MTLSMRYQTKKSRTCSREVDGEIWPMKTPTDVNKADQYTKPPTAQTTKKFVRWAAGYEEAPARFEEYREKAQKDLEAHKRFEHD